VLGCEFTFSVTSQDDWRDHLRALVCDVVADEVNAMETDDLHMDGDRRVLAHLRPQEPVHHNSLVDALRERMLADIEQEATLRGLQTPV
jgi:hypothetical protein